MADNYDDVCAQLQAGGLILGRDGLRVTGKVERCKVDGARDTRGWYILHEVITQPDNRCLIVGSFGIWQGNEKNATKIEIAKDLAMDPDQAKAVRERIREDRRKAAAYQAERQRVAQRKAEVMWRKCPPQPAEGVPYSYLARKGIGAHGIRYTPGGALVVPAADVDGRVHAVQFILDRQLHKAKIERSGTDKQFWPPGCGMGGAFHLVGTPAHILLICEGYATQASLIEATGFPVACAFNANNLAPVAKTLAKRYPDAKILVCADDDFASQGNPGITAASTAALGVGGAWLAPTFSVDDQLAVRSRVAAEIDWSAPDFRAKVGDILRGGRKLTDFNDLHAAEGLLLVRQQVEAKLEQLQWRVGGALARGGSTGGAGGVAAPMDFTFSLDTLIEYHTLIYGTETTFDDRRHRIIGLSALRAAAGKSNVRAWLEHPDRATCLPEQVGFDPSGEDQEIECNLWSGWPTQPKAGRCEHLLDLLSYLTGDAADWVLKWLAYPLQHPGAKMQTALLVHGPEGTGKNTFFGCIRQIYAQYACMFSQVELESQFNGWASGKLLGIGNEVVSRAELYHIQGRLKSMVTEPEWVINEKMLPARSEANHCNFIFFSNRIDIAKLDQGDRRYCVIWTPPALSPEFYQGVAREIDEGGVAALHHHLLHLDLGDFSPHAKPPVTEAKEDLMELGMDSTARFYRDWLRGDLELPTQACLSDDLYQAYSYWCQTEGIGKRAQKQTLLTFIGKQPAVRKAQERITRPGTLSVEKKTVLTHGANSPDDGGNRQQWLGKHVADFAESLANYRKIEP